MSFPSFRKGSDAQARRTSSRAVSSSNDTSTCEHQAPTTPNFALFPIAHAQIQSPRAKLDGPIRNLEPQPSRVKHQILSLLQVHARFVPRLRYGCQSRRDVRIKMNSSITPSPLQTNRKCLQERTGRERNVGKGESCIAMDRSPTPPAEDRREEASTCRKCTKS